MPSTTRRATGARSRVACVFRVRFGSPRCLLPAVFKLTRGKKTPGGAGTHTGHILYRSCAGGVVGFGTLDGCEESEVRLCDPCVRVCACVSRVCVPAPPAPPVSFYRCVSRVCPGSPRCLFTGTGTELYPVFEGARGAFCS